MLFVMWSVVSDRALYLKAAEDLRSNDQQWVAYETDKNCVLYAGPGSGKTKTLTVKLARMFCEDVEEPRGIACITYNNECARELEARLDALGIASSSRVFIGTVHSFSLTQILLPYAKVAKLGLPDNFEVATRRQTCNALKKAYATVTGVPRVGVAGASICAIRRIARQRRQFFGRRAAGLKVPKGLEAQIRQHRRRFLDRDVEAWKTADPKLTRIVEAYEAELRRMGVIDFDDMPLLALRALVKHAWLRKAIAAKYPILAVDEYQDLGQALHEMVLQLCFNAGIRLFAVGDVDQSIYRFNGAKPELLCELSKQDDVTTVRLGLNYRCGSQIVTASEYALGKESGYRTPDDAHKGTIYFHPRIEDHPGQANYLMEELIPEIRGRWPDLGLGEIAILYPMARIGNVVQAAATQKGYGVNRTDRQALYPRGSRVMRWLEQCAMWCCGGWWSGQPGASRVMGEGNRLFYEFFRTDDDRLKFRQDLIATLWHYRDETLSLRDWLIALRDKIIEPRMSRLRSLTDEFEILQDFIERLGPASHLTRFSLGDFAGLGSGLDLLKLSTLHSAKGREFDVVILFATEEGLLPRYGATSEDILEARRLFYVGFTRARHEVHIMYDAAKKSRFVTDVKNKLAAEQSCRNGDPSKN